MTDILINIPGFPIGAPFIQEYLNRRRNSYTRLRGCKILTDNLPAGICPDQMQLFVAATEKCRTEIILLKMNKRFMIGLKNP